MYLKVGGRDAVYLVGNEALEPLKRELRDTAVFAFDPSKVTGLTVRAGRACSARPTRLTFEQKDGTWTTKEAGYAMDAAKVAAFVAACRGSGSSGSSPWEGARRSPRTPSRSRSRWPTRRSRN